MILLGISVIIASLYAGAFVCSYILRNQDEWYAFPNLLITVIASFIGIVYGIVLTC